ncbi:Hypothetical protein A7982_10084 [Minicystis rosea]|nr:Hypothetical protein A7982_10084 [Minicystis rosea]
MPQRLAALLVTLALLLLPRIAAANAFPCEEAKLAWLHAAGAATALRIEPVACYFHAMRVRLVPDGAPPIEVTIEEPPGPAFARAGRWRVSPIVEIDDFKKLPEPQRTAFEKLLGWLREHHEEVVFGRAFERREGRKRLLGVDGPLLLVASVLLALLAWPTKTRIRGRDMLAIAGLSAGALALRFGLGAWAPHQVNGHGVMWIRAICDGKNAIAGYGPGFLEIFPESVCHRSLPPDTIVFAVHATFIATLPAVVFALCRLLGAAPLVAMVAGLAAMLDPVSIRFAATESYFALLVPLLSLTALFIVVSARLALGQQPVRAFLWALAAGLVAAQLARVHQVSWPPLALLPTIVLAVGGREVALRQRIILTGLAAAILGAVVLATSLPVICTSLQMAMGQGYVRTNINLWDMTVLAAAAVFVIVQTAPRHPAVAPAALHLTVMLAIHAAYCQSALWQMSFDRLYLAIPLVTLASLVPPTLVAQRSRFLAASAAALALLVGAGFSIIVGRTAQQREYHWLRTALAAVPAGCRIAFPRWGNRMVELPEYAIPAGREGRWEIVPVEHADEVGEGQCVWFVHTTACAHDERRALCEEIERRWAYAPAATITVPPIEQYDGEFAPGTPPVTVGIGPLRARER